MSAGSARLDHSINPSTEGEVQHCFLTELAHFQPEEGGTQTNAKEAYSKCFLCAAYRHGYMYMHHQFS